MSSTDETARDLASRAWTTIHSESATEQATRTAATAAIRLGRRCITAKCRRPPPRLATNGIRPPNECVVCCQIPGDCMALPVCGLSLMDPQRERHACLVERVTAHDDLQRPLAGERHCGAQRPVLA